MKDILELLKHNELLTLLLGAGGIGTIMIWLRNIPRSIYNIITRELTTELVITTANRTYFDVLKYIAEKYKDKNFRNLKISNGNWGYSRKFSMSIGYGMHLIRFNRKFILLYLRKEEGNNTDRDKETLILKILGRKKNIFQSFIKEIEKNNLDNSKIQIYKYSGNKDWLYIRDLPKRSLDSIFLEDKIKSELLNQINNFINNEQWYIDNGIPYQLGMLLYGPPGTGKTSIIKALCSTINYDVYYLPASEIDHIESALSNIPDKCVVVIEDIDSNNLVHSRQINKDKSNIIDNISEFKIKNLSDILNSLDGFLSSHGRILMATTNHKEKLSKALCRPGRIDIQQEIGYLTTEVFWQFITKFYPDVEFSYKNIKSNLTIAEIQNMILQNKSIQEIINFATNNSTNERLIV